MNRLLQIIDAFLILAACLPSPVHAQAEMWYNVREFGAQGDGETLDTEAINAAIHAAAEASGGTVYFPPGTYPSSAHSP